MNVSDSVHLRQTHLDTSDLDTSFHTHSLATQHDDALTDPAVPSETAACASDIISVADFVPPILARIFSFLDPVSLARCALVCRAWHAIAALDTTWRAAFMVATGLEERETVLLAHEASGDAAWRALRVAPALRRMEPSWRAEYTARAALMRRWRKSRTPTILTDPRIAVIDTIALSGSRRFVLSLSHGFSVASRSNAFTGKVAKDFLDAHGFASRTQNGHPNIEFSPSKTAQATDAYASRIVWGMGSGDISLTTIDWRGQSARGTVHNRLYPAGRAHSAPVTAIGMPCPVGHGGAHTDERHKHQLSTLGDLVMTFTTAAADGTIHVWHSKHMEPLWSGSARTPDSDPSIPHANKITHLEFSPLHGVIVAARLDGTLAIWRDVRVRELLEVYENARYRTPPDAAALDALRRVSHVTHIPTQEAASVEHLVLDASSSHIALLVHYANSRVFLRHNLSGSVVQTLVFGAPNISALTCLRCDFDVRSKPLPLPNAMLARIRASRLQEHKFVCAGTASGRIGVWEWDADGEPYDVQAQKDEWQKSHNVLPAERQVRPALVFDAHHNAVTALAFTPLLILVGCEDGTIKALDALSGTLVRVFNERTARRHPARMLAAGELTLDEAARFRVTNIVAGDDMFVAAIGMQVLTWRTDDMKEVVTSASRLAAKPAKRGAKPAVPERLRSRADMAEDVEEGQWQVQLERDHMASEHARQAALESRWHGSLDEDAALDYAIMLSQQESKEAAQTLPDDDLPTELMYDLEAHDGDSDATPLSPPLPASDLPAPSSNVPPSRAWDILCTAGRSASTTSGDSQSLSWSKLRTVSVPRHARLSASTSPNANATYGSLGSLSSSVASTPLSQAGDAEWPDVSRTSSRSPPSLGAWATRSPTLRAVDSSQAQSARRKGKSALVDHTSPALRPTEPSVDEVDDDLRLALELSLAEYKSMHE